MKNITIEIGEEKFEFTGEILMKHMRKIQPITKQQSEGDIGELDFFVQMAKALCVSHNVDRLESLLDGLNMKGITKFTKDFTKVMDGLNQEDSKKK